MDNYQDLARRVEEAMLDYQRSEDEGVVTEDFSESRGSSETKEHPGVVEKCRVVRCEEPRCQAINKFDNIMKERFVSQFFLFELIVLVSDTPGRGNVSKMFRSEILH